MAEVVFVLFDLNDGNCLGVFSDVDKAEDYQDSMMDNYPETEIQVVRNFG